jgi:FkbM family methyltransferase
MNLSQGWQIVFAYKECVEQLNKRVQMARRGKLVKLLHHPVRMGGSKVLENISDMLNLSLPVRADLFWTDTIITLVPEHVSCQIIRYGFFEEGLTRMMLEVLKPGMVFFDVGAHIGYYTVLACHIVGEKGTVHAFEPTPRTFDILRCNAKDKRNVILNNIAVSSAREMMKFRYYGPKYSAFNSAKSPRIRDSARRKLQSNEVMVEATSLDAYIMERGSSPDFLKIDVESSEWDVLQGAQHVLTEIRPIVSLEVGDFGINGVAPSRDLVRYLLEYGYRVYEYGSPNEPLVKHEVKENYYYDNLLFIPE